MTKVLFEVSVPENIDADIVLQCVENAIAERLKSDYGDVVTFDSSCWETDVVLMPADEYEAIMAQLDAANSACGGLDW